MDLLKRALAQEFGFRGDIALERVEAGFLSDNYSVLAEDRRYFLKGYAKTVERVAEVHKVKAYFASCGVPVILPMQLLSGSTYFTIDSVADRVYALFPFVTGIHHDRQHISDDAAKEIAHLVARMHRVAKERPLPIRSTFKLWDAEKLRVADEVLAKISALPEKSDFDQLALRGVLLKKELIAKNPLPHEALRLEPYILLHGDFHEQNLFFDESGKVKYVFDFGETKMGPRVHELWRSADYMFLNGVFSDRNVEKAILYLKTYNELNPISREEMSNGFTLYFQMNIHSFWVESEHYLKGNTRVDRFLEVRATSYLAEHRDEFLRRVLDGVYGKAKAA